MELEARAGNQSRRLRFRQIPIDGENSHRSAKELFTIAEH